MLKEIFEIESSAFFESLTCTFGAKVEAMEFKFDELYAKELDSKDPLAKFRDEFLFPQFNDEKVVYFTGNSLGLQPKAAKAALNQELDDWAKYGVEGHFEAKQPWFAYHEMFAEPLANLVGAKPNEVVAMNGLTTNLHLLMVSFYQPKGSKTKILCEAKAFPSDLYALKSQIRFHGLDPEEHLIGLVPREGESHLRTEDILAKVEEHANELALVMLGGVNYYSGQVLAMQEIAALCQNRGITVGYDLAHGIGNVNLELHDWGVDFASWCSYKYLNSGPGSVSGVYIHERHHHKDDIPRFEGWWGHDKTERFKMESDFKPIRSAEAWQLSNAPVLAMAVHKASLDLFMEAGFDNLIEKSKKMTAYLNFVIDEVSSQSTTTSFEIITPKERGCQLSILCHGAGRELFDKLSSNGVVADWREPNVIRIAPVPMYNSYEDCYRFGKILADSLTQ